MQNNNNKIMLMNKEMNIFLLKIKEFFMHEINSRQTYMKKRKLLKKNVFTHF